MRFDGTDRCGKYVERGDAATVAGMDEVGRGERLLECLVAVGVVAEGKDSVVRLRGLAARVRRAMGSMAGAGEIAGGHPVEVPAFGDVVRAVHDRLGWVSDCHIETTPTTGSFLALLAGKRDPAR